MTNYEELKRLALAATPGKWLFRTDPGNPKGFQHCVRLSGEFGPWVCDCLDNADQITQGGTAGERNAAFIAAANPASILDLIEQLDKATSAVGNPIADYAALEREHLGDIDKGTGIYHPDNRATPPAAILELLAELERAKRDNLELTRVNEEQRRQEKRLEVELQRAKSAVGNPITTTPPAGEMPELPEPNSYCTHADAHEYDVFDAKQMRAYARQYHEQQAGADAVDAARWRYVCAHGFPVADWKSVAQFEAYIDTVIAAQAKEAK